MTPEDFTAWRVFMAAEVHARRQVEPDEVNCRPLSERKTAKLLGVTTKTVVQYSKTGAPLHIGYACAAVAFGLPAWSTVHRYGD